MFIMADGKQPEGTVAKEKKTSFWQGLKQEWQKIIWTDGKTLGKQTLLVIVVSIIMGVIIVVVDNGALQIMNLLMK